jgi:hypothetical protein
MTRNRRITAWLSVLGILGIVAAPARGTTFAHQPEAPVLMLRYLGRFPRN